MMASFMSYFAPRKDPKQSARDAIVGLRAQLAMVEKKEEYLQKQIDEDMKKAKANVVSNKLVAGQALKRKNRSEKELERINGTRMQLEMQIHTLEEANLNAETMMAMKKGSDALKVIHGNMTVDQVNEVMDQVNDQRQVAEEISDVISQPYGEQMDDDELRAELEGLEQEELNERLMGDHVPAHHPPTANKQAAIEEDDEEAQLRQLQAELAM
ncbi:vacuolar-sorting protein SNF7 [Cylindrobasidium torrendii FP15055 ss-10]|uniref:Vacuolar-sorting protein SNF7 n=1 Tax=Cylindrobasidium torrendii FP15055 ss-10 TaxID=1314674 RepID=A0A0D7BU76_9AGAR|nr:vacuolar-sorting protein SNF7 [Cylindrobasidium torrendii FP15055 ss-10]